MYNFWVQIIYNVVRIQHWQWPIGPLTIWIRPQGQYRIPTVLGKLQRQNCWVAQTAKRQPPQLVYLIIEHNLIVIRKLIKLVTPENRDVSKNYFIDAKSLTNIHSEYCSFQMFEVQMFETLLFMVNLFFRSDHNISWQ